MNEGKISKDKDDLLTDCERSMRYHQARIGFFSTCYRGILFVIFATSGAAALEVFDLFAQGTARTALFAVNSLLALAMFVFDPAGKARVHEGLHRRFAVLAGAIAAEPSSDEALLTRWQREIYAIYADEPPVYRALNAQCHNQMAIALNAPKDFVPLAWYYRLLRHWLRFEGLEGRTFPNQSQQSTGG